MEVGDRFSGNQSSRLSPKYTRPDPNHREKSRQRRRACLAILTDIGPSLVVRYAETGLVRPAPNRGHEHFGWKDGISQPGVKGIEHVCKGQRPIDAERFVFGYSNNAEVSAPLGWLRNGSFLVFRRLKQFVPEFEAFLSNTAKALSIDPDLLGAKLMGRWKNGAPLTISDTDDSILGTDPERNNNFDFTEDADQARCPFAAHIRKTNPRSDFGPQELKVDVARIMRQGIPFGPEVTPDERSQNRTSIEKERGLMFVCYQTSIANQFELVQQFWANSPSFVMDKSRNGVQINVGYDPIIGNSSEANRSRFIDWPGASSPGLSIPTEFVVATGGIYAFVPSVSALKGTLSEQ